MRIPDPDPGAIKSLKNLKILNIYYKISQFISVLGSRIPNPDPRQDKTLDPDTDPH